MSQTLSEEEFLKISDTRVSVICREIYQASITVECNKQERLKIANLVTKAKAVYKSLNLNSPLSLQIIYILLTKSGIDFFEKEYVRQFWKKSFLNPSDRLAVLLNDITVHGGI